MAVAQREVDLIEVIRAHAPAEAQPMLALAAAIVPPADRRRWSGWILRALKVLSESEEGRALLAEAGIRLPDPRR